MLKMGNLGAVGIGAMIIFIAIVLISGIAAYVFISTSTTLESQSYSTGSETISETSTGIRLTDIEAHNTSGSIDKLLFTVTPMTASPDIDLTRMFIEISNSTVKVVLNYSISFWVDMTSGSSDLFGASAFPSVATEYGVIVLTDLDSTCSNTLPIINRGDRIMLAINTTACFNNISTNKNIWGTLVPEEGNISPFSFRTPSSIIDPVFRVFP